MSADTRKLGPAGFMLIGALGMSILIAAAWGAMGLLRRDDTPPPLAVASADAKPDVPPVDEPLVRPAVPEPSEPASAPVETVNAEEGRDSGEPAETKPSEGDKRTLEEILEEKARKSAEELAKAAEEDGGFEADKAHLEANFLKRKKQFMAIIDGYFDRPLEEREAYMRESFRKLGEQVAAEREAAGLPPQSRNNRRMMGEFFRMAGQNLNDEEKEKVLTFTKDIMRSQMAKFEARMEQQLKGPGGGDSQP